LLFLLCIRLGSSVVFGDAGGRLLLWPLTGGKSGAKYTVLVEGCGSKVVCLAAPQHAQTQQQVGGLCLDLQVVMMSTDVRMATLRWEWFDCDAMDL
jgi:hypothetical protein